MKCEAKEPNYITTSSFQTALLDSPRLKTVVLDRQIDLHWV